MQEPSTHRNAQTNNINNSRHNTKREAYQYSSFKGSGEPINMYYKYNVII